MYLFVLTALILLWIAAEDFRSREVALYKLILSVVPGIIYFFISKETGKSILINFSFITLVFLVLFLYYRLIRREAFIDNKIGKADILILFVFAFWLSPVEFVFFYVLAFSATLLLTMVLLLSEKVTRNARIPLAGILSVLFVVYYLLHFIKPLLFGTLL